MKTNNNVYFGYSTTKATAPLKAEIAKNYPKIQTFIEGFENRGGSVALVENKTQEGSGILFIFSKAKELLVQNVGPNLGYYNLFENPSEKFVVPVDKTNIGLSFFSALEKVLKEKP